MIGRIRPFTDRTTLSTVKTLLGSGSCALMIGAGAWVTAAPAAACPYGTVPSDFSGVCVSGGTNGAVVPVAPPHTGAVHPVAAGYLYRTGRERPLTQPRPAPDHSIRVQD
jgi:hypothetical protein